MATQINVRFPLPLQAAAHFPIVIIPVPAASTLERFPTRADQALGRKPTMRSGSKILHDSRDVRPRNRGPAIAHFHRTAHSARSVAWRQMGVGFSFLLVHIWFYFTGYCPMITPNVAALWPSSCAGQAPDLSTIRRAKSPDDRYWPCNGPAAGTQPAQFHPVASPPSGA